MSAQTPEVIEPVRGSRLGLVAQPPLSIGQILGGACRALGRYPRVILGLAAVIAFLTTVAHELLARLADSVVPAGPTESVSEVDYLLWTRDALGRLAPLSAVDQALDPIAEFVLAGLLIVVVLRGAYGWPSTVGQAWAVLRPRFIRLVAASIMLGLASAGVAVLLTTILINQLIARTNAGDAAAELIGVTVGGVILLVVLQTWLATATPVIVVEKEDTLDSLTRTRRLLENSWWRIFWLLVITRLLTGIVDAIFGLIPVVGDYAAAVVDAAFVATVTTLVYFDLRLRKTGPPDAAFYELIGVPTKAAAVPATGPASLGPATEPSSPAAATGLADPARSEEPSGEFGGAAPPASPTAATSATPIPRASAPPAADAPATAPPGRSSSPWGPVIVSLLVLVTAIVVGAVVLDSRQQAREKERAQAAQHSALAAERRQRSLAAEEAARRQNEKTEYLRKADAACAPFVKKMPSGQAPNTWTGLDNYYTRVRDNMSGMLKAWATISAPDHIHPEVVEIWRRNEDVQGGIARLVQGIRTRDVPRYESAVSAYEALNAKAVYQRTQDFGFAQCGSIYYSHGP